MDKPLPERPAPAHPWFGGLQTWTPIITSLAALGLSIYNLVVIKPPKVEVFVPHVLRMGQKSTGNAYSFVQPTITAPAQTEDLEIITKVELTMVPTDPSDRSRAHFWWDELIKFGDPIEASYKHATDPNPILIPPDKPQQPIFSFVAEDWNFKAADYQGTLTFHRRSDGKPIVKKFCLTLSKNDIEEFGQAKREGWWYPYRNDDPSGWKKREGKGDRPRDCYARWDGY
ncbi:hypothetical protein ABTX80_37480 [Streptomyces erythrochromogenes]|uniref:hypothetical protein n=1 Tax=Streptomyces erythrochromogenes TaxID=285574 RepID=UPI00331EA6AD